MTHAKKLIATIATVGSVGITSVALTGGGGAVLTSTVESVASDYAPSTNFTIRVATTSNASGQAPSHAALRFFYDPADVSYVSASGMAVDGWLGTVDAMAVGSEEATTSTLVSRDIPTLGNFSNSNHTPDVMEVTFQVSASPTYPIDISFDMDPGSSSGANSFLTTSALPLPVAGISYSATEGLAPISSVDDWMMLND